MKKTKRFLALLLVFGLLLGVGGVTAAAEETCQNCSDNGIVCVLDDCGAACPCTVQTLDVSSTAADDEETYEFTDAFQTLLDWLGDNFGQQVAEVCTKVLIKVGAVLAKLGVKLILKTVVKGAIKSMF
ncbi:MAG: hypothetical protein LBJ12_09670 [Oscillospiraceae bacterium]|jgi:pyruvate-formate lyase-activating enzyme|nr:hypothetical protein [Oscillospiraceae bacterium]